MKTLQHLQALETARRKEKSKVSFGDKMKKVVEFLLEHETMSGQQFADCMEGKEIGEAKKSTLFDSVKPEEE